MFEFVMVLCFAYAGFCCLLPEGGSAEEGEEEGGARRRRDAALRQERRRSGGRTATGKKGALSLLRRAARPGQGRGCGAAERCR